MPYNHSKINALQGGWYVVFYSGEVITEDDQIPWVMVPNKKLIKIMGLKRHNKYIEIEGKENYLAPGETHCREIMINPGTEIAVTKQTLQGWFIGYYDGNRKIIKRVNADTGKITEEYID